MIRFRVHQNLIRLGPVGQTGTNVDRISGYAVAAFPLISHVGDNQTGADAGVHSKQTIDAFLYLMTHLPDQTVDVHCRLDSPNRVIFVGVRNPKQRQHFIAHKLIDDAFMALNDVHSFSFDAAHDRFDFFRIEPFIHRCVAGKIRENDGGLSALTIG